MNFEKNKCCKGEIKSKLFDVFDETKCNIDIHYQNALSLEPYDNNARRELLKRNDEILNFIQKYLISNLEKLNNYDFDKDPDVDVKENVQKMFKLCYYIDFQKFIKDDKSSKSSTYSNLLISDFFLTQSQINALL